MRVLVALLLTVLLSPVDSSAANVAIIIDDIGYDRKNSFRAAALHKYVTLAFLPDAPHSQEVALVARRKNLEMMLHIPMQSTVFQSAREPFMLSLNQSEGEFKSTLRSMLTRFPEIRGVNNHQGSLLTRHPGHMQWLMEELLEQGGLYFVDSRTHKGSVAAQLSKEAGLETAERTFFLDPNGNDYATTNRQANKVLSLARTEPFITVIAHPFSQSIKVLKSLIAQLEQRGHKIVTVSHLIMLMENQMFLTQCNQDHIVVEDCFQGLHHDS